MFFSNSNDNETIDFKGMGKKKNNIRTEKKLTNYFRQLTADLLLIKSR